MTLLYEDHLANKRRDKLLVGYSVLISFGYKSEPMSSNLEIERVFNGATQLFNAKKKLENKFPSSNSTLKYTTVAYVLLEASERQYN
ncbi:hypothetical protein NPIL_61531 [Nephila pilipes]|uniref:Uncharacterized protein n=1 Tax=Nephila pilipes TaxID=299642 RepID=A0A8X6UJT3_NEPPI|nr:hypothetical protein NPIL_61531 [Nephila pilipes]